MDDKLLNKILKREAVSFDIFDTLIVRKCGNPQEVFNIVAKKYNEQYGSLIVDFKQLRIDAEKKVRHYTTKNEISVCDIYNIIADTVGGSSAQILMELEKETELEVCIANKPVVDLYNQVKKLRDTYIISDMYFDGAFITRLLETCGIGLPKKVYVSVDYNQTKRNRQLFRTVLRDSHLYARNMIHIGDNFISDFLSPKLLGMHSYWLKK